MYTKSFYAFDGKVPVPAVIRNYTAADFGELIMIQSEAFPPLIPKSCCGTGNSCTIMWSCFRRGRSVPK